jgi:hypothetical protein
LGNGGCKTNMEKEESSMENENAWLKGKLSMQREKIISKML